MVMASTTLNISNIRLVNVPSNYDMEILSSLVSGVELYGPKDEIEELSADSVVAQIDCQSISLTVGQQTIPVTIQIPSSTRSAIRKAVQAVKDEVLVYNGSVCDAVWSASAGYNTQTGVYGTCSSLDAWGTEVPYLQSVESPYEEQYHNLMRRVIGKDYRYTEYNDSKTGQPYESADTTHKDLGGFVQYNTFVSNGKSYRYIGQFVSSRYCFDFSADENGTPCMNYYGFGHGVGMSQCGMVGYAQEQGMGYRDILRHYYTGVSFGTVDSGSSNGGLFGWLWSLLGL